MIHKLTKMEVYESKLNRLNGELRELHGKMENTLQQIDGVRTELKVYLETKKREFHEQVEKKIMRLIEWQEDSNPLPPVPSSPRKDEEPTGLAKEIAEKFVEQHLHEIRMLFLNKTRRTDVIPPQKYFGVKWREVRKKYNLPVGVYQSHDRDGVPSFRVQWNGVNLNTVTMDLEPDQVLFADPRDAGDIIRELDTLYNSKK